MQNMALPRGDDRVAEGARLLSECVVYSCTQGSNPCLPATSTKSPDPSDWAIFLSQPAFRLTSVSHTQ
jgi:hypothetical protein